jgi:hypothetical protein
MEGVVSSAEAPAVPDSTGSVEQRLRLQWRGVAYLLLLSGTVVVLTVAQAHGGELAVWTSTIQSIDGDGGPAVDVSCSTDARSGSSLVDGGLKAAPFCVHLSDLGVERQD